MNNPIYFMYLGRYRTFVSDTGYTQVVLGFADYPQHAHTYKKLEIEPLDTKEFFNYD